MKTTPTKQPDRKKTRRVMRRLLTAVDRSIAAAEEAKKARDELTKLALSNESGGAGGQR